MRGINLLLFSLLTVGFSAATAQTYNLDATTDGSVISTCSATLYDEGGPTGDYGINNDYEITFASTNNSCIRAVIESYEFEDAFDYLIIYDGPSSASGICLDSVTRFPNITIDETGNAYYAQSGYITIRITSDGAVNKAGFGLSIDCPDRCLPPSAASTTAAGETCETNTPICDLNGYLGNTSAAYPTDHENIDYYDEGIFCGGINNNSWLSFVADSTATVLDVWVRNCQGSINAGNPIEGIQLQVFDTDCSTFTPVSNCWSPAKETNGHIVASGLTPGEEYLIMVDGYAQDVCEYIFAASSGAVVAYAGEDHYICEGQTVNLTASGGATVNWTSSPSDPDLSGQENQETISVSPGETTTYTATVTGSNPSCPGTADVTVFVNSANAEFTGLDSEYCEDDATPVTLSGNYATGSFSGNGISGDTFIPANAGSGTQMVTYSYNYSVITAFYDNFDPSPQSGWAHGASSGSDSWAVGTPQGGDGQNSNTMSNPDPTTDHTSTNLHNQVYGQGLDYTEADGAGGYYDASYEWLLSPEIDCSGLTSTQLSFWRYANFETDWDEAYVEISNDMSTWHDLPHPQYPQDDEWTHVVFDISAWADNQSSIWIRWTSQSDNLQTYAGWNIDDVTVTGIQSGGSCISTDVQYTSVNELPQVNAGSDISICESENASLSGSVSGSVSGGSWTSSGSGNFTDPTSLNTSYFPSAQDISDGSITLTLTSDNPAGPCGTNSDQLTVDFIPSDDPYFAYESGTFCATGPNVTPTDIATPGGTFSASPAGLSINSSTGEIDLSASTTETTYTITYTTNGTCPESSMFELTITSGFDAEFYYNDPYCQNDENPLPLHNSGSNGNYSASPAGLVFQNTGTGEIDLANSEPGTYSITNTISASGGCAEATHTENNITIYEAPEVSCPSDESVCMGSSVLLQGTSGGSTVSVQWTTNGAGSLQNAGSPEAIYIPDPADVSNSPIRFYLSSNDPAGPCEPVSDSMLVNVYPVPDLSITTDSSYCNQANGSVHVTATGNNPFDYTWTESSDNLPELTNVPPGMYHVTVTDFYGCTASASANIYNRNPGNIILDKQDPLCFGDSTGIFMVEIQGADPQFEYCYSNGDTTLSSENTDSLTNLPAGLYNVTVVDYSGCEMVSDTIELNNPQYLMIGDTSYTQDGITHIETMASGGNSPYDFEWSTSDTTKDITLSQAGDYYLTLTDDHGCTATAAYRIDFGELLIPTVITPNGDGYNDTWEIKGISAYEQTEISIFTRWGDDVFYFNGSGLDYADAENRWDGTRNGKNLPSGTYVFVVSLNDGNETHKGTVSIIR